MSRFKMTTEDPFYDDDGVLIDEDANWTDIDAAELDELGIDSDNFDPFDTINS